MKKIKFRAWNRGMREMSPPFTLWEIFQDDNFITYLPGLGKSFEDETTLMQFTGLKDKNGKEIYEGDIVRHICYWIVSKYFNINDLGEPSWKYTRIGHITIRPSSGVCINGYLISENLDTNKIKTKVSNGHARRYSEFAEVIGNIYENPELLKVK